MIEKGLLHSVTVTNACIFDSVSIMTLNQDLLNENLRYLVSVTIFSASQAGKVLSQCPNVPFFVSKRIRRFR